MFELKKPVDVGDLHTELCVELLVPVVDFVLGLIPYSERRRRTTYKLRGVCM